MISNSRSRDSVKNPEFSWWLEDTHGASNASETAAEALVDAIHIRIIIDFEQSMGEEDWDGALYNIMQLQDSPTARKLAISRVITGPDSYLATYNFLVHAAQRLFKSDTFNGGLTHRNDATDILTSLLREISIYQCHAGFPRSFSVEKMNLITALSATSSDVSCLKSVIVQGHNGALSTHDRGSDADSSSVSTSLSIETQNRKLKKTGAQHRPDAKKDSSVPLYSPLVPKRVPKVRVTAARCAQDSENLNPTSCIGTDTSAIRKKERPRAPLKSISNNVNIQTSEWHSQTVKANAPRVSEKKPIDMTKTNGDEVHECDEILNEIRGLLNILKQETSLKTYEPYAFDNTCNENSIEYRDICESTPSSDTSNSKVIGRTDDGVASSEYKIPTDAGNVSEAWETGSTKSSDRELVSSDNCSICSSFDNETSNLSGYICDTSCNFDGDSLSGDIFNISVDSNFNSGQLFATDGCQPIAELSQFMVLADDLFNFDGKIYNAQCNEESPVLNVSTTEVESVNDDMSARNCAEGLSAVDKPKALVDDTVVELNHSPRYFKIFMSALFPSFVKRGGRKHHSRFRFSMVSTSSS